MANKTKYTCKTVFPSGCSVYTGNLPDFVADFNCDGRLDSLLEAHGTQINLILESLDLTSLDKKCLDFDPNTVTIKELESVKIAKLCEQEAEALELSQAFEDLDLGSKKIQMDLSCLFGSTSPCDKEEYSLISVLKSFTKALCKLETDIANTECKKGTSGTSGNSTVDSGTSGVDGTSGTSGISNTSGTSGTSGQSCCEGEPVDCTTYIVRAPAGNPVTVTWTDCCSGLETSDDVFPETTLAICSRTVPTGDYILLATQACSCEDPYTCTLYNVFTTSGGVVSWTDCCSGEPTQEYIFEQQIRGICSRTVPVGNYQLLGEFEGECRC